jgi:RNA polymerase sigma-70 factor, ECF subfamily
MTESQELDKFAVLRAAAGDREALADVLGFLQAPLYRYILRLVFRPDVAEDVLQDVLFIICRKLSRLRDPELIRPWAFRIATRQGFRQLRSENRRNEQELDTDIRDNTVRQEAAFEWEPYLVDWVDALPAACRSVIALHYLEELSLGEVSAVLEISPGTVKSRLAYGLSLLRKQANRPTASCPKGTSND